MKIPLTPGIRTLGGMFDSVAEQHPAGGIRSFFVDEAITFRRLSQCGRRIACNLVEAGVLPGEPVAVLIRSSLDLLQTIHGVALAGAAVMPLPLPVGTANKAFITRLEHVIADSAVRFVVVDDAHSDLLAALLPQVTMLPFSPLALDCGDVTLPAVDADDLALIQYTSGSTSNPRGVALTHRNILAGIRAMQHVGRLGAGDVLCHWLPLSHDMGMFCTLAAVASGIDVRISPPGDFIKRPDRWLRKFCDFGATVYAGPNFSYRHLMDAVPADEANTYDLSAARILLNGAEPIDPTLVIRFQQHFAPSGLLPQAMTPGYGLAEATLGVSFSLADNEPSIDWVDRDRLNRSREAHRVAADSDNARGVVSCGPPVPGIEVRITLGDHCLSERVVGEIEIRGESVMNGYYRESAPTVLYGGWRSTGDLGYLADGQLYITGRSKEMLTIGGQNYYPQDIEDPVRRVAGIHKQHAVAVVLPGDESAGHTERIGVLAEVSVPISSYGVTISAIRAASARELGGASVDVVLMRRNGLLRTTSGKFQRLLMRDRLLKGALDNVLIHLGAGETVATLERSAPLLA